MKNKITIVILAMLLVVGCAQIPTQQFVQYKKAFNELNKVQEDILLDFDQALKKQKEVSEDDENIGPSSPYPDTLQGLKTSATEPDVIEVRRLAMLTINRYNDVLTKLVEGKSIEDVKTTTEGLVKTIGKFVEIAEGAGVPGIGSAINAAKILAGKFEELRLRKEFKKAVREGVPAVYAILDFVKEDLSDHYTARFTIAQSERLLIVEEITNNVINLNILFSNHSIPPDTANIQGIKVIEKDINSHLKPVSGELNQDEYPYKLEYGTGNIPAYTILIDLQVTQIVSEIESLSKKYNQNVTQVNSIGSVLIQDAKLIEKTKIALNTLVNALDKPLDIGVIAEEILDTAFNVKREFEAFRAAQ
ncbi:MAG: hypothetical protein AABY49_11895 [Planctomycetota bacterium]